MGRTKGNLIELFVDKAVLAVAVIIALWIMIVFVIGSPNTIKYANKKIAPGQIDQSINNRAAELKKKLNGEPNKNDDKYKPKVPLYLDLIQDSIKNVNVNIDFPLPDFPAGETAAEKRTYRLPKLEQIEKTSTAVVTMAAFVPTEELSDALTYNNAKTKLADLDLVTIESSVNAKQLYEGFRSAFAGKNIRKEWKEEQYAKPVFAKVELQRRTLLEDGSWSQWSEMPRTKICHLKKRLQPPEQADEYGTPIAMEQFATTDLRNEILQPPVYDNAIPSEKWLCPSLYNERQKKLEKEKEELKRQQLEADKARKLMEKTSRTRQPTTRQTPGSSGTAGGGGEGAATPPQPQTRQPARPVPVQPPNPRQPPQKTRPTAPTAPTAAPDSKQTMTEEQKYSEMHLSENTNLNPAGLEKLVFWAHDDTTKPGEKYQYRIRIGVLNPIAGKPWFSQEQKDLQSQPVLFSDFSEPTETIEIPNKLHFFATDSKETEKGRVVDKTVEIKVARYTFGNWVTKTFSVKPGEQIGTVIDAAGTRLEQAGIQINSIDLTTGNIVVDIRRITEWAGTGVLRAKEFYELLYCKPGQAIQTMPVKERFWPEEITKIYNTIKDAEAAEPVVLSSRDESKSGVRTRTSPTPSESGAGSGTERNPPGGSTGGIPPQ